MFKKARKGIFGKGASCTQCLAVWLCAVMAQSAVGAPRVEVLEGDGAINNIRLHRAKEPVVRVVDEAGRPIPNIAVTFILPGQGAGGTFTGGKTALTVMTDDDGRAIGRGLRPNGSPGQFQIRVTTSFEGQTATASITQTNAEPAKGGASSKTILIIALIGGAAAAGAAFGLKGSSSSSTPPSSPGAVITPGTPNLGPPK